MGRMGLGPVVFHPRPHVTVDDLVLPHGVIDRIERHVLGVARYRTRLRAGGQHLKRGVLLYGPPGNGKTLTVRYLLGAAREHTILLLTGGALHFVRPACGLARLLEPAIVVLEDVDLVAEDRDLSPHGNPFLFDVLNEMDGVADDADVAFVLTTNRADLLEPALAARPGRVDLAVEIGAPDAHSRRRLMMLYGRRLDLVVEDWDALAARTEGVAASFIKELLRVATLVALEQQPESDRLTVTETDLERALNELLSERSALTRVLLGGDSTVR